MILDIISRCWHLFLIPIVALAITLYFYPPKIIKEKLLGVPILDPNIGSIVLHYRLNGCMGQDEELTWVGIIENNAPDSSQGAKRYEVRIIGYSKQSLTDKPVHTRYIHACQLLHKRDGFQLIYD